VFDRYSSRLYDVLDAHRRSVWITLLVLTLVSLGSLYFVKYESSMTDILPRDETINRTMDFFRNSNVTGKVVISFGMNDPGKTLDDLLPVVDKVASSLDRSLFTEAQVGLSEAAATDDMQKMLHHLPGMIFPDDLEWVKGQLARKKVSERLRATYLQLLKPEGVFMGSLVRTDPIGLNGIVLRRLSALTAAMGYDVTIKDGHFVSRDGRHAMIIAKSTIAVVDTEGSKRMLASLQGSLVSLPPFVTTDVIAGHAHTVSNEKLIRSDLNLIGTLASIGFFVLYVVIIRDLRSILIFIVPYLATLFAIPLTALAMGNMSYWVIAMGSTIAGITIDYGSHVYFSVSGRGDPAGILKQLIRPIAFGAFTTIAVFAAFFSTGVPGYIQLAVFSIACILISTFLSLYVLPHFLPRDKKAMSGFAERISNTLERGNWSNGTTVAIWLVCTLVLTYFALQVRFERDIRRVDGTERSIVEAEERFHQVWGGRKLPAVLVAAAPDREQALELNEAIYREAVQAAGTENITSIARFLPSDRMRKENEQRWAAFWSSERRQSLRGLLEQEGAKYGFSETAFAPFFAGLDEGRGDGGGIEPALAERFIQKTAGGYQVLTYFPDTPGLVSALGTVIDRHPGTFLVSGVTLSDRISAAAARDLKLLSVIAGVLVLVVTYFAFWDVLLTVIAMIPLITSLVWLLGIMALVDLPISIANMIAGVIVIGLSSDYGIFMSFLDKEDEGMGTVFSITLCTVTTVIGAGVLVFAKHPAIWSVGVTVVIGVMSGYLSSLLVVPKLIELVHRPELAEEK